jgi:hypothetical protein
MPATLTIAMFVFGAVLLLIGLVGGAFKLFGTEVTGTVGPRGRIAALVLGAGFIAGGLIGENRLSAAAATRPETNEPAVSHARAAPVESAPVRNVSAVEPEPTPANVELSGIWRDETGTVYQVSYHGITFDFKASNSLTGLRAEGSGSIQGLRWTSSFRTNAPSTGTGSGILSADGNQMIGSFKDSWFGTYSRTIDRQR